MGNTLCCQTNQRSLQDLPDPQDARSSDSLEAGHGRVPFSAADLLLETANASEDTDTVPALLLTAQNDPARSSCSQHLKVTTNTILSRPGGLTEELLSKTPEEMTEDIQLLSAIGSGAFGVVYRGVYQGGDVAVKLAVTDGDKLPWTEAFLASQLRHPHVVQTYIARGAVLTPAFMAELRKPNPNKDPLLPTGPSEDGLGNPRKITHDRQGWRDVLSRCGAAPGKSLLMLVQEFCDRGTLTRAIRSGLFRSQQGPRSDLVARRMLLRTATEVCRGMIHLHAASVVHGDLKPANVLLIRSSVDRRGFIAKIADFGLARLLQQDQSRVESATLGTAAYMSPEAFNGVYSKPSDVYAFGILLWEMLVGERPYEGLMIGHIMLGVSFQGLRPEWPEARWPELCELGRRCLLQEGEQRPSFRELEKALIRMEEGLREESRRQSIEDKRGSNESYGSPAGEVGKPQPPYDQPQRQEQPQQQDVLQQQLLQRRAHGQGQSQQPKQGQQGGSGAAQWGAWEPAGTSASPPLPDTPREGPVREPRAAFPSSSLQGSTPQPSHSRNASGGEEDSQAAEAAVAAGTPAAEDVTAVAAVASAAGLPLAADDGFPSPWTALTAPLEAEEQRPMTMADI